MSVRANGLRGDNIFVANWQVAALTAALVLAGLIAGHLAGMAMNTGPLSSHMAQHIVVMNLVAPIAALLLLQAPRSKRVHHLDRQWPNSALVWAVVAQVGALWTWHLPVVFTAAKSSPVLLAAMHLSLLAVALFFWVCIFSVQGNGRWKPIVALLVTGKLFCLLGALLIFAPRPLYALSQGASLGDQQLAGLLMIAACPLTYVVAGVVIAARWLADLEREDHVAPTPAGAST